MTPMRHESDKLKLGKGASFFVKTQLRRLRQEDDTWEADFFPIPCSESEHDSVWWGIVLSHSHEYVLAQHTVEEPPTVNDLAHLLAEAMRRPLFDLSHRPRHLYLRARPEWAELLPHLKQIGIEVVSQDTLPKWDRAFGDLQAQAEQARTAQGATLTRGQLPTAARKEKPMARSKKPAEEASKSSEQDKVRLYTLDVFIISGPITEKFAKKNPVVSRTIQIRGDQTLKDLHHAIFDAFGRWEEHMYEFQFGKGPMDPKALRYVLPSALEMDMGRQTAGWQRGSDHHRVLGPEGRRPFRLLVRFWRRLVAPDQRRGHRGQGAQGQVPQGDKEGREKPTAVSRRRIVAQGNRQKQENTLLEGPATVRYPEDKIKAAILHADIEIRDRAARYFGQSFSSDLTIMPLVIKAVETYGRQNDAYRLIGASRDLPQTEETIAWGIDELNDPQADQYENYAYNLSMVLVDADPALLLPRESDILEARHFLASLRSPLTVKWTPLSRPKKCFP